jgi:alpha-mannosidase
MRYDEITVLIPSHSLEDFPTDLGEEDAASLLNAFAIAWHPALLATASVIPGWDRADEPPDLLENRLFIVPTACRDWLPSGWVSRARGEGAVVVDEISDREDMVQAALGPLEFEGEIDPGLVADFLAFGTCYLQMELLTRHMHHFSSMDEVHLQREAVAAAEAAISDDAPAAKTHLRSCFETLLETRERFYPVDCYLLDLCLLIPRLADKHLVDTLQSRQPVNFLLAAEDLDHIAEAKPEVVARLREMCEAGTADVVGGELRETPTPLYPVESLLWGFHRGHETYMRHLGRTPKTWGRRRFGLSTLLPQVLSKFGYHSALHLAMDDGIYPDAEQSKVRWEGNDGTIIDGISRIPLAADSATSFLRFSQRMAESMEEDQVAGILFARWPEVKSPWFEDFRRIQEYTTALGRFVTFDDFIETTDTPGRLSSFDEREYLSPFFVQCVARREADPVTRFADHIRRRAAFDAASWNRSMTDLLLGRSVNDERDDRDADIIELAGPDGPPEIETVPESTADTANEIDEEPPADDSSKAADKEPVQQTREEAVTAADRLLDDLTPKATAGLANIVMSGGGEQAGYLVLNPLSFARRVAVDLPNASAPPAVFGPVKTVQFDGERHAALVDVPGSGFAWIPTGEQNKPTQAETPPSDATPVVEENVIRNEFFEVHINAETGGIQTIKEFGRSPNRLSQQLAFRFPRERVIPPREEGQPEEKTCYSEMRCQSVEVTCEGPAMGEIVTSGEIVDQKDDSRLAGFRQTVRLWRGRPVVEIDIELDTDKMPDGDPWSNYFGVRFAWNDSAATVTRSVQQGAHGHRGERIESPHYLEIAAGKERTTILTNGLPFHRKTGMRMLDTILISEGETRRTFRLAVAVDVDYPMQAALDFLTPPAVLPTENGPPRAGETGWFFHLDAKNVQITRITGLSHESVGEAETWEEHDHPQLPEGDGYALRLVETEGRNRQVKLRCFRTPTHARQRDFRGRTVAELKIEDDAILVDFTPYEIVEVELRFGESS